MTCPNWIRGGQADKAFTLIELLIVVAIIAILAAIAVPNFLEAQTRAKISRCRNDQRAVAVAMEAYMVDNNAYSKYNNVFLKESAPGVIDYTAGNAAGYALLSTPIAYISNSMPDDPFIHQGGQSTNTFIELVKKTYEWAFANDAGTQDIATGKLTQYVLQGYGPDSADNLGGLGDWAKEVNGAPTMQEYEPVSRRGRTVYDPTNGTISVGDIYRVQGKGEIMNHYGNNGR